MASYFRAIAVDYDGTITMADRPGDAVLEAIRDVRGSGRKVVLVTGRMLFELRADFPEVEQHFDAIVAENGGMLWRPNLNSRRLAEPVSAALHDALLARSIAVRKGEVLLATDATNDAVVLQEISRLGLDCQIVHNRGALMVLPAGVSKGTGLFQALADLGISFHNCVGIGDAENDHSLIDACEVGVATANAIDSLKAHADIVLPEPNGVGVGRFLRGMILNECKGVEPKRWSVVIGTSTDGQPVTIPGSRTNLLITGGAGSGKSYLAGLVAEQLLRLRYSLCILDLEGDHVGLAGMRGVIVLGQSDPLPTPEYLGKLLLHRFGSVVLDLSTQTDDKKRTYVREVLDYLQRLKQDTGLPHWIFLEEAHVALGDEGALGLAEHGICLVTYHPQDLSEKALRSADLTIDLQEMGATLRQRDQSVATSFTLGHRTTMHLRHLHKYEQALLPENRRFFFRDDKRATETVAANLAEFAALLTHVPEAVVRHHARGRDFSRWILDVFRDSHLAHEIRDIEKELASASVNGNINSLRNAIISAIEARFSPPIS